MQLFGTPPIF